MTTQIANPFPMFFDRRGLPLTGGKAYIGAVGQDPETSPVAAFFDADLMVTAPQPIDVIGGLLTEQGNPASVFVDADKYSLRVRDADGAEIFYTANANAAAEAFQPLDSDLTALAALATTAFGRALLTKVNASDIRGYLGIPNALPLSGGTMTGTILRQSAGAHLYFVDGSLSTGRVYVTASGAADPRADPARDIWLEEEPA